MIFLGAKNPAGAEGEDRLHEQAHHAGCTPSYGLPRSGQEGAG